MAPIGSTPRVKSSLLRSRNASLSAVSRIKPEVTEEKSKTLPLPNLSRYSPNQPSNRNSNVTKDNINTTSSAYVDCKASGTDSEINEASGPLSPTVQLKDAILESLRKNHGDERRPKIPVETCEHRTINHAKELNQRLELLSDENFRLKLRIYFLEEKEQSNPKDTQNDIVHLNVELEQAFQELRKKNKILEDTLQYLALSEKRNEQLLNQDAHINIAGVSSKIATLEQQIAYQNEELMQSKKRMNYIKTTFNSLIGKTLKKVKGHDAVAVKQLKESFEKVIESENAKSDCEEQTSSLSLSNDQSLISELAAKAREIETLQKILDSYNIESSDIKLLDEESMENDCGSNSSLIKETKQELSALYKAVEDKNLENRKLLMEKNEILDDSKRRSETLIELVKNTNKEVSEVKELLVKSETEKRNFEEKLEETEKALGDLQGELEPLRKRLEAEINDKNRIIGEAEVLDQMQVEQLEELNFVVERKQELEDKASKLSAKLIESEEQIEKAKVFINQRDNALKDLAKQLKESENEKIRINELYKETRSTLDSAEKEMFLLKRKVSSESKDELITVLKLSIDEKDKEINVLNSRLNKLDKDLDSARTELFKKTSEWREKDLYLQKIVLERNFLQQQQIKNPFDSLNNVSFGIKNVFPNDLIGDCSGNVEDDKDSFESIRPARRRFLSSEGLKRQQKVGGTLPINRKSDGDVSCQIGELLVLRKKYSEAADRVQFLERKLESMSKLEILQKASDENIQKEVPLKDSEPYSTCEIEDYSQFGVTDKPDQLKEQICLLICRIKQLEYLTQKRISEITPALSSSRLEETHLESFWEPSNIAFDTTLANQQRFLASTHVHYLDKSSNTETVRVLWTHIKELKDFLKTMRSLNKSGDLNQSSFSAPSLDQLEKVLKNTEDILDATYADSFASFRESDTFKYPDCEPISLCTNLSESKPSLFYGQSEINQISLQKDVEIVQETPCGDSLGNLSLANSNSSGLLSKPGIFPGSSRRRWSSSPFPQLPDPAECFDSECNEEVFIVSCAGSAGSFSNALSQKSKINSGYGRNVIKELTISSSGSESYSSSITENGENYLLNKSHILEENAFISLSNHIPNTRMPFVNSTINSKQLGPVIKSHEGWLSKCCDSCGQPCLKREEKQIAKEQNYRTEGISNRDTIMTQEQFISGTVIDNETVVPLNGLMPFYWSSDSDIWSEPDRNVALERMGLDTQNILRFGGDPSNGVLFFEPKKQPKRRGNIHCTRAKYLNQEKKGDFSVSETSSTTTATGGCKDRCRNTSKTNPAKWTRHLSGKTKLIEVNESRNDILNSLLESNKQAIDQLSQELHLFGTRSTAVIGQLLEQFVHLERNGVMELTDLATAMEAVALHLQNLLTKFENLEQTVNSLKLITEELKNRSFEGKFKDHNKSGVSKSVSRMSGFNVSSNDKLRHLEQQEMSLIRALSVDSGSSIKKIITEHKKELILSVQTVMEYLKCTSTDELEQATENFGLKSWFEFSGPNNCLSSNIDSQEENEDQMAKDLGVWTSFIKTLFDITIQNLKIKNSSLQSYVQQITVLTTTLNSKENEAKDFQDKFHRQNALVLSSTEQLSKTKLALTKIANQFKKLLFGNSITSPQSSFSDDENVDNVVRAIKQLIIELSDTVGEIYRAFESEKAEKLQAQNQIVIFQNKTEDMEKERCQYLEKIGDVQSKNQALSRDVERLNEFCSQIEDNRAKITDITVQRDFLQKKNTEIIETLQVLKVENAQLKEDCHCLGDNLNQTKKEHREKERNWDLVQQQAKEEIESMAKTLSQSLIKKEQNAKAKAETECEHIRELMALEVSAKVRAQVELEHVFETLKETKDDWNLVEGLKNNVQSLEAIKEELKTKLTQYKRRYREAKDLLLQSDPSKMKLMKSGSSDLDISQDLKNEIEQLQMQLEEANETISTLRVELKAYELLNKQSEALFESTDNVDSNIYRGFVDEMHKLRSELFKSNKVNSKLTNRLSTYNNLQSSGLELIVDSENSTPVVSEAQSSETLNGEIFANEISQTNDRPQNTVQSVPNKPEWFTHGWNERSSSLTQLQTSGFTISDVSSGKTKDLISSAESLLHSRVVSQLAGLENVPSQHIRSTSTALINNCNSSDHMNDEPVRDIQLIRFNSRVLSSGTSFSSHEDLVRGEVSRRSNYSSPDLGIESDPNRERGASTSSNASSTGANQQNHKKFQSASFEKNNRKEVIEYEAPKSLVESNSQLKAIGRTEDFYLLKQELSESLAVIEGIKSRVKERLFKLSSTSPSKSAEYSTLKEVDASVFNLQVCLKKGSTIVENFIIEQHYSQIVPAQENPINEHESADIDKLESMRKKLELAMLKIAKYEKRQGSLEHAFKTQLGKTSNVLKQTKMNLLAEKPLKITNKTKPNSSKMPVNPSRKSAANGSQTQIKQEDV